MTTRRFLQLDVFSALPGSGNPLAVVLDAEGLDDAAMQAIARWTKLPETTFVFPASDAASSYRLRMFSPQKEVPFAGHPSVGTAHAVLDAGLAAPRDGVLVQDGIAGQLPLRVEQIAGHRSIAIRTPRARHRTGAGRRPTPERQPARLAAGRLAAGPDGWRAYLVGGGTGQRGRLAQPGPGLERDCRLGRIHRQHGRVRLCACSGPGAYDLAVRAFVGNGRRFEDAASGAANAVLAAWLDSKDALPGTDGRYVVSQGREIGFDALLELRIDANGEVWSGGQVQTVIRGTLDWE